MTLPDTVHMAQTVTIDTPESMASSALALWENGARLLKIKLDDHLITERLMAIRSTVPEARLIVDANESRRSEGLAARCQLLADLGVEMLEQPLPQMMMRRWRTLFIRCRCAPMKAAIPAAIWPRCVSVMT